jgi:hypothetical protein
LFEEKECEGHCKCMQNPHRWIFLIMSISNGRWYTTWFLMVEEIFPLEDGSPKVWLRSPKQL